MDSVTNSSLVGRALETGSNVAFTQWEDDESPENEGILFILIGNDANKLVGGLFVEEAQKYLVKEPKNKEALRMGADIETRFIFEWMKKEDIPWAIGHPRVEEVNGIVSFFAFRGRAICARVKERCVRELHMDFLAE